MFRFFRRYRDAVKKWLLIFFLSVVSLSMVITLAPLPGGNTQMEVNVLAEVDGDPITTQDLQRSVQSRLRNSPLANNPEMMMRMASIILDDMILRRAVHIEAKKLGIGVTDLELSQDLRTSMPFLYPEGKFVGVERYRDFVSQQAGMTVPQFEAQLREGLLLQKMRAVVTDGVRVSPDEVRQEFRRRNAKAKIEYVLFDPSRYLQAVEISQEALESFFKKNAERYKEAEFQQHYGQALALIATAEAALVRVGQEFMEYAVEDAAGGAPFDEERAYRVILIEDQCIALAWQAMDLIYKTVGTSHAAKDGQMIGRTFRNLAVMNTHPALQLDRAAIMAARTRFGLQPPIMPKSGPAEP